MTYAIGEIIAYLVLAAALGLTLGFLLWYRKLTAADADVDAMNQVLVRQQEHIDQVEADRDALRATAESLTTKAERNATEVEVLRGRVSQLIPLADRVPEMRDHIEQLTDERNQLAAATGTGTSYDLETTAVPSGEYQGNGSRSYLGPESVDSLRENPDDLRQIAGVGPHLENLLNENGIYTFRQIALLTEDGITDLDDQLGFKGRIERNEWVGQASRLHQEKYGEEPQIRS